MKVIKFLSDLATGIFRVFIKDRQEEIDLRLDKAKADLDKTKQDAERYLSYLRGLLEDPKINEEVKRVAKNQIAVVETAKRFVGG